MSYVGHIVEIPMGVDGLTSPINPADVRPTQLLKALNVDYKRRTVAKGLGTTKYNSTVITAAPSVFAGFDWEPTTVLKRQVVATSAGELLKDDGLGSFSTTLKTGLSTTARGRFFEGGAESVGLNKKLFYTNGTDVVQVLSGDGATTANLTTPPADWTGTNQPIGMVNHNGRMWGFGNLNDAHRIYGSTLTNHEDFTSAGSLDLAVYPGVGGRIYAAVSFKGRLFIFKHPYGIFWLDDSDTNTANWTIKSLTDKTGCADTPYGAVNIDDDVAIVAPNAHTYLLTAVETFGDVSNADMSARLFLQDFIAGEIDLDGMNRFQMAYNGENKELVQVFKRPTDTSNTGKITYDFADILIGGQVRPRFDNKGDTAESVWVVRQTADIPVPFIGGNDGFVRKMDEQARKSIDDTGAFTGEFQTAFTDFGFVNREWAGRDKIWDFVSLTVESGVTSDLKLDLFIDGQLVSFDNTVTFPSGVSSQLGKMTLGKSPLGGGTIVFRQVPAIGIGRRFSVGLRNTVANEDFSVIKIGYGFRVAEPARPTR